MLEKLKQSIPISRKRKNALKYGFIVFVLICLFFYLIDLNIGKPQWAITGGAICFALSALEFLCGLFLVRNRTNIIFLKLGGSIYLILSGLALFFLTGADYCLKQGESNIPGEANFIIASLLICGVTSLIYFILFFAGTKLELHYNPKSGYLTSFLATLLGITLLFVTIKAIKGIFYLIFLNATMISEEIDFISLSAILIAAGFGMFASMIQIPDDKFSEKQL